MIDAKAAFTPAQKKMSTDLIFSGKAARLESLGGVPTRFGATVHPDQAGKVLVDIKAKVSPALLKLITGVGGQISFQSVKYNAIRAKVPLTKIEQVAASVDVKSISQAARAHTNGMAARVPGLNLFVGAVTSQGVVAHRANQVVNQMGFDGSGVKVGVLSDSASAGEVAALIATGDLPIDTIVLPGQDGSGEDEGTAMMEIVHDMAPGAKLFFATAFNGEASFAQNIHDLRFVYGCDIIVDDVTYFDEGAYQDSVIAQAVNEVTANGALYFSSAANSGNLTNHTSGTWENDFKGYSPAGAGPALINLSEGQPVLFNNFGTTASPTYFDTLSGLTDFIALKWADPLGVSTNDYDLYVLDSTASFVKAASFTTQTGAEDPFEYVFADSTCYTDDYDGGYCPEVGDLIVPVLYNGISLPIRIETDRGRLLLATSGATYGHNAGANTVSMAATYWGSAHRGLTPFTGFANPTEVFSSDGPRKIFFNPNGTPITPGNISFANNGGTTLKKPDMTAADGAFSKTPNFLPFFGTSAAAPHAAAIAALVKSAKPSLTNAQIKQAMTSSALDTMAVGWDRDSGSGIAMATQAVQAALSMF